MKAIYSRFGKVDFEDFGTIAESKQFLDSGEDNGHSFALGIYDDVSDIFYLPKNIDYVIGQNAADIASKILDDIFTIGIEPGRIEFLDE